MKNLFKAIVGLILVFLYHIPRLIYLALIVSYADVFDNKPTLTASPQEHLNRARKILKRGRLSELLYAAVELRFAVERMAKRELIFAEMASQSMLKKRDPVKILGNLHRLDPDSASPHEIFLIKKETGERIRWGEYKPLDRDRIKEIQGRLGDILHPKDGLPLGIPYDPWYTATRKFLNDSVGYLESVYKDNTQFFAFEGLENIEMVKIETEKDSSASNP
jgi:hypothetical protein